MPSLYMPHGRIGNRPASGTLGVGRGGSAAISPARGMISGNIAQGIRAPQIPLGVADVRHTDIKYTPMPENQIFESIAKVYGEAGNLYRRQKGISDKKQKQVDALNADMARTALRLQEEEDQTAADGVKTDYRNLGTDFLYGFQSEDGEAVPGYLSSTGEAAVRSYEVELSKLEEQTKATVMGMEPAVRMKAVDPINREFSRIRRIMAVHRTTENKVWQADVKDKGSQAVRKLMLNDPATGIAAWEVQRMEYQDYAKRTKMDTFMGQFALQQVANNSDLTNLSPDQRYIRMDKFYKSFVGKLEPDAQNAMAGIMADYKRSLPADQARFEEKLHGENRALFDARGGPDIAEYLFESGSKTREGLALVHGAVHTMYPDEFAKAQNAFMGQTVEAFNIYSDRVGYEKLSTDWENFIKPDLDRIAAEYDPLDPQKQMAYSPVMVDKLDRYVKTGLFKRHNQLQLRDLNVWQRQDLLKINKLNTVQELEEYAMSEGPEKIGSTKFTMRNEAAIRRINATKGLQSQAKTDGQDRTYIALKTMLRYSPATDASYRMIAEAGALLNVSETQYDKLESAFDKKKNRVYSPEEKDMVNWLEKNVTKSMFAVDFQEGRLVARGALKGSSLEGKKLRKQREGWAELFGDEDDDLDKLESGFVVTLLVEDMQNYLQQPDNKNKTPVDWLKGWMMTHPTISDVQYTEGSPTVITDPNQVAQERIIPAISPENIGLSGLDIY